MGLVDRLRAIVDGMPDGSAVTLSVDWLRELVDREGEQDGMGRLLTLAQAGEIVGRSASTIRTWANSSQLEGAFKLNGRDWRIPENALARFVERQQATEQEPTTVSADGPVDLNSWRHHVEPDQGAA